jgi:alpha/beta superfamily hydrolase
MIPETLGPMKAAYYPQPVTIRGPEGPLEGLWADPGRGLDAAVICHPHPAHGGSMHSRVVHTVYRVLHAAGHPTLRFNFRGVGGSAGGYSGWNEERGDVAAAARYARERTRRRALWAAGFSFGAWVGLQWAVEDEGAGRFIALGLPVDHHTFEFLSRPPAPMLIVQGERDRYGSPAGVRALAERLRAHGPVEVRVVAGADHFFTGHHTALAAALRSGLGLTREGR